MISPHLMAFMPRCRGRVIAAIILFSAIRCDGQDSEIILENKHLKVVFGTNASAPALITVEDKASGEHYRFESESTALAFVDPQKIHDPALEVTYAATNGNDARVIDCRAADDRRSLTIRYQYPAGEAAVSYSLQSDEATLRKTVSVSAGRAGAYVAGVKLWSLATDQPADWGGEDPERQVVVCLKKHGGALFTYEVPRARIVRDRHRVEFEFRPGYRLTAGQSSRLGEGSIVFFAKAGHEATAGLETARLAFFRHVAARVRPILPAPIKFTAWGPWLQDGRDDRLHQVIDDLARIGTDLVHIDAGWMWPLNPFTSRFDRVRNLGNREWDLAMSEPSRFPNGLLSVKDAAERRGMALSIHIDTLASQWVREVAPNAFVKPDGSPLTIASRPERRTWVADEQLRAELWAPAPIQSLNSRFGELLRDFSLQAVDRYSLGGIIYDFHRYHPDYARDRESLANGWEGVDIQYRRMADLLAKLEERRPGMYKFYCSALSLPWMLKHATHIHSVDPGTSPEMKLAMKTDFPARALAYERRLAWQRHYDNFVPPWGVKGDIAGWSMQQGSPIPINLAHTELVIGSGEGWTQNLFTCFATTSVRDLRFSFAQMPERDKQALAEWLRWDRRQGRAVLNCRVLARPGMDPNSGITAYSHVAHGVGTLYFFNSSFAGATATIKADELSGFTPGDRNVPAYLVYPLKAPLGKGRLSYGDVIQLPLIGKDCVVVEVGASPPTGLTAFEDYRRIAQSVRRSFGPLFLIDPDVLVSAAATRPIRFEIGSTPADRRLGAQLAETLAARTGNRGGYSLQPASGKDAIRIIIGTADGLSTHPEMAGVFEWTMYNQYIRWNSALISAPLVARLGTDGPFCLIAPRPEQLAQLDKELSGAFTSQARPIREETGIRNEFTFEADIPAGRSFLRFRPRMERTSSRPLWREAGLVHYVVRAETSDGTEVLWAEEIPPFLGDGTVAPWWSHRLVSVAKFRGKAVKFQFAATLEGGEKMDFAVGFEDVGLYSADAGPSPLR